MAITGTSVDIYDPITGDFNDTINLDGSIGITVLPSATGVNLFANNDTVPSGVETTVLSYTVPVASFHITQLVGWGTYVGEFLIRQNGTIVGGGRTSTATQTLNIPYLVAPIPAVNGDTITVTVLQYGPGPRQFRVNLLGE